LKSPLLTAVVTNTRSRQTMGDDQPRPGIDTAQPTFFVADQDTGSDDASATPALLAPRNCGQSVGPAARGTVRPAAATRIMKIGRRLVIAVLDERDALGLLKSGLVCA
jgi:hypothetical protein